MTAQHAIETLQDKDLTRRQLLTRVGTGVAALYAGNVLAAGEMEHDHSGHHPEKVHDHSKHRAQLPEVLTAVNNCLDKSQRCIAHCIVAYGEGDLELAGCLAKAQEMRVVCDAFSYLLASNSTHITDYSRICATLCEECELECKKHKDKHIECRQCMEACADTVDQIKLHLS